MRFGTAWKTCCAPSMRRPRTPTAQAVAPSQSKSPTTRMRLSLAMASTSRPTASQPSVLKLNTDGCDAGALVTVRLTYPNDLPSGAEYWKWGRTADNTTQHWYRIPATLQGRVVSFVLRD